MTAEIKKYNDETYHRDRKESMQSAESHKSVVSLMRDDWGIPYYYLFDERTGKWLPPTED